MADHVLHGPLLQPMVLQARRDLMWQAARAADLEAKRLAAEAQTAEEARRAEEARKATEEETRRKEARTSGGFPAHRPGSVLSYKQVGVTLLGVRIVCCRGVQRNLKCNAA